MPLRKRVERSIPAAAAQLEDELLQEWRHPDDSHEEPVIIEENGQPDRPVRLYVIWNAWGALSQIERSELIMDVYEKLRGEPEALRVTVAMGLTPDEAERLGIRYQ